MKSKPQGSQLERICQLERWLTNAGICCDCGNEIHHFVDEPFAACSGCGRDFGEWTGDLPTIQALRIQVASTQDWAQQEGRILPFGEDTSHLSLPECLAKIKADKEEARLKARRASLLERIETAQIWTNAYPMDQHFQDELTELQEELRAVESALGWPEPKEPEEANQDWCPTCLCLYDHEDPMQSCQCDEDEPDSASDETITRH